ncbi:MAG: hypothetical protein R6V58_07620 [Planctomycetota bacterium]
MPDDTRRIIDESLEAAVSLDEPNRVVTVASWPVRAMVRSRDLRLSETVDKLLRIITDVGNPVRRADALAYLLDAVHPAGRPYRERVLAPLRRACRVMKSWKRSRHLRNVACVLYPEDPDLAEAVLTDLSENIFDRHDRQRLAQAKRRIRRKDNLGPQDFLALQR